MAESVMLHSPYEVAVGAAWARLPKGVQRSLTPPLEAAGMLKVHRASRGLAGLVARMIELPASGNHVPTTLRLEENATGILWIRQFANMKAVSTQTISGNRVTEVADLLKIRFEFTAGKSTLSYRQVAISVFGIRIPLFLGPQIAGVLSESDDEDAWHVSVTIGHRLLGTLSTYSGVMRAK